MTNWWDEACKMPPLTKHEREIYTVETRESHGGPSLQPHGDGRDATIQELIEIIARYETTVADLERRQPSTEIQEGGGFREWIKIEPVKQVERVTKVWVRDDEEEA